MKHGDSGGTPPISTAEAAETASDGNQPHYPMTPEQAEQAMAFMREMDRRRAEVVRAALHKQRQEDLEGAMVVEDAADDGAANLVDERARRSAALRVMADAAENDDACTLANERRACAIHQLAVIPAMTTRDLARKLAVLVKEVVGESEMPEPTILMLAASALADAVVLDSGPIEMPPREQPSETTGDEDTAEGAAP